MIDRAQKILQKMNKLQVLKRLANRKARNRILDQFNRENLDDVGPIGGEEQGIKILSEINSMVDEDDEFVRSLMPRMDIL
jgi:hypothetical protein